MKRIKEIYIITLILIIIGVTTTFATGGTVNTNGVRMRKSPSTEAEIITNLHNGEKVEIIEKDGEWYKIKYDNQEGYIYSDFVNLERKVEESNTNEPKTEESNPEDSIPEETHKPEEENFPKTAVTVLKTKIYIIPSLSSSVVTEIKEGKTITIHKQINNWSYISYGSQKGWARNYIIETALETSTEEPPKENENNNDNNVTKPEKPATKEKYVNVDSANIRKKPNTTSDVVGVLSKNAKVTVTGEDGDWYKIEYEDIKGYILGSLVSEKESVSSTSRSNKEPRQEEVTPITKTGYIRVGVANIRKEPTTNSEIIATLKQKTEIEIFSEESEFYKIESNGVEGYISKGLVVNSLDDIVITEPTTVDKSEKEIAAVSNDKNSSETNVVSFAKKYLGYSYVSGGTAPSGFDCSGFTYYVFNSCGYSLSRSCSAQAKSGTSISKANLKSGDLVFFNNGSGGSIGHVGIYIGEGNFIHAANARRGVVIDTINSGYYNTYYYSARRVI